MARVRTCVLTLSPWPRCSGKSLETLVKMGVRLGCAPNSPHLVSPSVNAATIAELQSQTQHLAPLHQAMGDVHIADAPAAGHGAIWADCRPFTVHCSEWTPLPSGSGVPAPWPGMCNATRLLQLHLSDTG
jgi:hypothetical protein